MKKILATLVASAAMIGIAYASTAEGVVATVDPSSRTIILEDGTSFVVAEDVDLGMLAPGVSVRLTIDDTSMEATDIEQM